MKKISLFAVMASVLAFASQAHAGMSYTCYNYVDGKPTGGTVTVVADSKAEADKKAEQKYKEIGVRSDYVNCK